MRGKLLSNVLHIAFYIIRRVLIGVPIVVANFCIVFLYLPIVWGVFVPDQSLNVLMDSIANGDAAVSRITGLVFLVFTVFEYIIYHTRYRSITVLSRFSYAVKVLLLMVQPILLALVITKIAVTGQVLVDNVMIGDLLLLLGVGAPVYLFLGWVFLSLIFTISEELTTLEGVATRRSLVLPMQMIDILFRRIPDYTKAPQPTVEKGLGRPKRKSNLRFMSSRRF